MSDGMRLGRWASVLFAVAALLLPVGTASAGESVDAEVQEALASLYAGSPAARALGARARAILVFPRIVKAGLLLGVQGGDGALLRGERVVGHYNTTGVSYGPQLGAQTFGYALFLMTDAAVAYLDKTQGWELGVGPSIVVVDSGMAKSLTTTTGQDDVYAFFFNQRGLMAGAGLQGTKITRIER